MIQENDSLSVHDGTQSGSAPAKHYRSVYDIISSLPANATPAQQDSAVRANIPARTIHYSQRPDTLHLPGLPSKPKPKEIELGHVEFDNMSPFADDSIYISGRYVSVSGKTADPIPYQLRTDDAVTSVLFVCIILTSLVCARGRRFIASSFHDFFRNRERSNSFSVSTGSEVRYQGFMLLQTFFILALMFFDYTQDSMPSVFNENSPYLLIGMNTAIIALFLGAKTLMMKFVNWVFFSSQQNIQFERGYFLMTSVLGLALMPLCLVMVYFNLSYGLTWTYFYIVITFYFLLLIYKCQSIFFDKKHEILQLFVYFCTAELMPAYVLVKALVLANKSLIINY